MTRGQLSMLLKTSVLAAILPAHALIAGQVVTDGSVGAASTLSGPNFSIPATLGRQVGPNLFHSFSTFNLDKGDVATFTASASTKAILARVTGGSVSNIDGTIATRLDISPTTPHPAAFYLINPAGVIFGPDAHLDVGGSFVVTTADTVQLANGGHFDATTPQTSVLTSAAPAAFGFLKTSPQPVTVNGSTLAAAAGKALSVIAGSGTQIQNAFLFAPAGRINVVAVGGSGNVIGDAGDPAAALVFDPQLLAGDISISNSQLTVSGTGGGSIAIQAANLGITTSLIDAQNSGASDGGGITFAASGDVNLSGTLLLTSSGGTGSGGDILIQGNSITVNNTSVLTTTSSPASGGNISFVATTALNFLAGGNAESITTGVASAGNLNASAQHILIDAQSSGLNTGLSSTTESIGGSGSISISASDLTLQNAGADISTDSQAAGNSGSITINTGTIVVNQSATIATETFAGGDAGNLSINASSFSANGGSLEAGVGDTSLESAPATGAAGTLTIYASSSLTLSNTFVLANTDLSAGNTSLPAPGKIQLSSPSINFTNGTFIDTSTNAASAGGLIELNAENITLSGSSQVSASTSGSGNAGNIVLAAAGRLIIRGDPTSNTLTGLFTSTSGTGAGGDISVAAGSVHVSDFGVLSASGGALAPAGNVQISATKNISLARGSEITIAAQGAGGDIGVVSRRGNLILKNESFISAEAGAGGNINLDAARLIEVLDSVVSARAMHSGGQITIGPSTPISGQTVSETGPSPQGIILNSSTINGLVADGGKDLPVRIRADQFLDSADSQILSNATLAPPEYDIAGSLVPLPGSLALPGARLLPQCGQMLDSTDASSFIVTGSGGAPPEPGGFISGEIIQRRHQEGR